MYISRDNYSIRNPKDRANSHECFTYHLSQFRSGLQFDFSKQRLLITSYESPFTNYMIILSGNIYMYELDLDNCIFYVIN